MSRAALLLIAAVLVLASPLAAGDWNPRLAADYLDSRQEKWFVWANAKQPDGSYCISCHTSIPYMLARPSLRKVLGEGEPTAHEAKILDTLRGHAGVVNDKVGTSVESVLAAFAVALKNEGAAVSDSTRAVFDRMWSLQTREGKNAGAWKWFNLDLDPWEVTESPFFGASLAALATGAMPARYRTEPAVKERIAALTSYLNAQAASQPLHNRLVLLWASTKLPEAMPADVRKSTLAELWSKQQSDGGWTAASLGPFKVRDTAPAPPAGESYATAFAAFIAVRTGVPKSDPKLAKALDWLKSHQDREQGFWPALSMNKKYEPESMQIRFMQEAATGYASAALLEAGK